MTKSNAVLLLVVFVVDFVEFGLTQSHDQPCGPGNICDPPFDCQGGTCKCVGEDGGSSFWSPEAQMCFLLADSPCNTNPSDPTYIPCIPTAGCYNQGGSPQCVCHGRLKPNREKKCHLVYNTTCATSHDMCDPVPFLKCSLEKRCDCGDGGKYVEVTGIWTCVALPESECDGNDPLMPDCIDGTSCEPDLKCHCPPPSKPSSGDPSKCILSYNDLCVVDDICDTDLACDPMLNRCFCKEENVTSTYDQLTNTCLRWADQNCEDGMDCVPGAICRNIGTEKKCQCRWPLSSSNNRCYLQLGESCTRQNDLCDPNKFLSCNYEGKCTCGDDAIYITTPILEGCQRLPGSECSDLLQCVEGAECRVTVDLISKCECTNPAAIPSVHNLGKCYVYHGDDCDASNICDPNLHFECDVITGQCICDGGEGSIYDSSTRKCLRLANEMCTPESEGGMGCIHTASCSNSTSEYKCHCRSPMLRGMDGLCYLQLGDSCIRQNDLCDPNKFLSCNYEGKCTCGDDAIYITTPAIDSCQRLPGSECSDLLQCVEGAECRVTVDLISKCECTNPAAIPSVHNLGKCYVYHGDDCDASNICDPNLHFECDVNGQCICDGGEGSIYDSSTRKCLRLANEVCTPESEGGMGCIHTASCSNSTSEYKCHCRSPMLRGMDGLCYLQLGDSCIRQNDLCDPNKFLSCNYEGKCTCGDDAIYITTPAIDSCQRLPGSECSDLLQCVEGTECRVTVDLISKCECENHAAIPSLHNLGKCYVYHGDDCDASNKCDPNFHFECGVDGQCICEGGLASKYDTKTKKCVRLANELCVPVSEGGMGCIHTASCIKSINITAEYKCHCRNPMSPGKDGFCYLQHEQSCVQSNDFCDPNKFLECNLEGNCACRTDAIFDTEEEKCLLLPGSECRFIEGNQTCVDGTECKLDSNSGKSLCLCSAPLSIPSVHDRRQCFLQHGHKCGNSPGGGQCDPYSHLECKGDCRCEGEGVTSIYDNRTRKCMKLADQECLPEPDGMSCIHTATCKMIDSKFLCQCRFPMSRGSDGHCYLTHWQNCTRDNDLCNINQYLACDYESKCSCGNGAIYESPLETCLLLPEQECNSARTGSQSCFTPAQCVQISITGKHICQCPGSSHAGKMDPRRCVLHHGQPCANSVGNDLCDPFQYLQCSDSLHCGCQGGFRDWFDPETKTCFLKARQSCIPSEDNPFAQKCAPNSHCFQEDGVFICACKAGFEPNRNGQCFLPHLSKCSLNNDLCDPASFLSCNLENTCTCGMNAVFNEMTKMCELLSNSTCTSLIIYPESQPCVDNAMCARNGRCECIQEFEENKERLCFLGRGKSCDKSRDMCDPKSLLECGHISGSCVCQGEENGFGWYSRFQKKCFRIAGSPCGGRDESSCMHNAFCDPVDKICVCNETLKLVPNQEGFCFIPHGAGCTLRNDLCDPAAFLECVQENPLSEAICRCQRDYETFFDTRTSSCRLIHDRPCNSGNGLVDGRIQLCDSNAICEANAPGNFTHRCRCNDKFVPNPESICYLPQRSDCLSDPSECDPYGYLTCRRRYKDGQKAETRQCLCATDKMYYDEEQKQCFSFPGELCDGSPTGQKCRKNAHCDRNYVCECNAGYEPTPDGQCLLKYREKCEGDAVLDCHRHANLECRSGYCLCPEGYIEHYYYSGGTNKTICLPGYGMNCEDKLWTHFSKLKCSPDAFLTCSEKVNGGVCLCEQLDQEFIGTERQCRSTRGRPCDNLQKICAPGMECKMNGVDIQSLQCECAENYTVNGLDPNYCVSGSNILDGIKLVPLIISLFLTVYARV